VSSAGLEREVLHVAGNSHAKRP